MGSHDSTFPARSNAVDALARKAADWRRTIHANPETGFEEFETTQFIVDKLEHLGCDRVVVPPCGTGAIALIEGRGGGPMIGLRADIDALHMDELSDLPYRSRAAGRMHACGHDGHTAILLGVAGHLCESRDFPNRIVLVFQPAEENGLCGARRLIEDGLLDDWPVERMFALHNWPGLPVGEIGISDGAAMSAFDTFEIIVRGRGGHGGQPHKVVDPIIVGNQIVSGLQTIVSRTVDPLDMVVVSVCEFHAGSTNNVIPHAARLSGSVRAYRNEVRHLVRDRMAEIVDAAARAHGAKCDLRYELAMPPVHNDPAEVERLNDILRPGFPALRSAFPPGTAGEDFGFFSRRVPSVFFFLGNGDSHPLHHPEYDFSDDAIAFGIEAFARIARADFANGNPSNRNGR